MRRHRETTVDSPSIPWHRRAGWIHIAIMGGFVGLLLATTLDFVFLEILPLHLHVFWPARVLGTVSGAAMLWGVSSAIVRRRQGVEKSVAHSRPADWWLLATLFILAVTGFWLEVAVTVGLANPTNDIVLLIHSAMAMELVLLVAFTKLAHAFYRPMALFAYYLREARAMEEK